MSTPAVRESWESASAAKVASIGKSLHVKGELTGSEDLVIEGKVEGSITLSGYKVTVGNSGHVSADIRAKSVVIGGQVNGSVHADERVEVSATGRMVGDIRAPRVVLVDGATFKGKVDMDAKSTASSRAASSSVVHEEPVFAGAGKS
jgi:cytoskeletal protein CcmA (bactofilin family)